MRFSLDNVTVELDKDSRLGIDWAMILQLIQLLIKLLDDCPQPDGKIAAMLRGALKAGQEFDRRPVPIDDGTVHPQ